MHSYVEVYGHSPAYGWIKAGQSEIAPKTLGPNWEPFVIRCKGLVNSPDQKVQIRIYNSSKKGNKNLLGTVSLPIIELRNAKSLSLEISPPESSSLVSVGSITLHKVTAAHRPAKKDKDGGGKKGRKKGGRKSFFG